GGMSSDSRVLGSNLQYDPESNTWTERAAMPTARAPPSIVFVHGVIYVLGGRDGNRPLATVEAYDPTTDSWRSRRSMLAPRDSFAAAELNGIIYSFGGTRSDEVEAYDPVSDTW